jgi:outer membrane protein assembly factor BamB
MGARGQDEYLIAIDVTTGGEKWTSKAIGPTFNWKANQWNQGPSATPTVDGDLIFALGGQGMLVCVDTKGKEKWRKDLPKELGAEVNPIGGGPAKLGWGFTWSPLVDGDKLILTPGGKKGLVAALDKKSGKLLWQTKDVVTKGASYASPLLTTIGGVRQYVALANEGLFGVSLEGKVLWKYEPDEPYRDVVIPTPVVHGDQIFLTNYSDGAAVVEVKKKGNGFDAKEKWTQAGLKNRDGGVVLVNGTIYGHFETKGWSAVDPAKGKATWSVRSLGSLQNLELGRGSLTYADGNSYCYGEEGLVALVEASPKKRPQVNGLFVIPKRSKLNKPSGKTWTHPVVANGRLYLRDQDYLWCYEVKAGGHNAAKK